MPCLQMLGRTWTIKGHGLTWSDTVESSRSGCVILTLMELSSIDAAVQNRSMTIEIEAGSRTGELVVA